MGSIANSIFPVSLYFFIDLGEIYSKIESSRSEETTMPYRGFQLHCAARHETAQYSTGKCLLDY